MYGFSRGFSAMFYGSVICGFIYFAGYKFLKTYFQEYFGANSNPALVFFVASFIAEFFTLLVYYPYDLIKCRLQSKNYHFKYRNIPHAFRKEISQGSIFSLYRGSLPFLVTHCLFVSFQFTIYEYVIKLYKTMYGDEYAAKEIHANMMASFLGGAIGSAVTNGLDVLTINKQANPDIKIMTIAQKEGLGLFTKGLSARVYYNSMQSIVFFNLVMFIGKIYNVELSDE